VYALSRALRATGSSYHSSQVVVEGAAILDVVIVDVDLLVDPGR
jgi:hypothetical protein